MVESEGRMKNLGVRFVAWIVSALVATALVSLGHSLFVQAALSAVGAEIPLGLRLVTFLRDFFGLVATLGPILLGALLVAYLIAGWLKPRAGLLAPFAYPLAGWAAVALALLGMRLAFGFSPLAGARTGLGFLVMSFGGLAAGAVFGWMIRRRAA
ncbi:MAG: hypothetical protein ACRC1J_09545 [Sandaracinobacteroides sp.]